MTGVRLLASKGGTMKTAVIGLGAIGATVATRLNEGGIDVLISQRNLEKAQDLAAKLGLHAKAVPIAEAVAAADVIVLAIGFEAIKQFVQDNRAALSGKIIVDPSNPIAPDGKGGFIKTIPQDQSSGEIISRLLPGDAELVKAFGSLAGTSLASAANRTPEKAVLFLATDYPEAGEVVAKLITAAGFAPVRIGGIDQSIRIEVFGDLHEYGKLGKMVSAKEAEGLVSNTKAAASAMHA